MEQAKGENGQSSVSAYYALRTDLDQTSQSTFVALGEGRQRNVREEGFELLVEKRQWNCTQENKLFK